MTTTKIEWITALKHDLQAQREKLVQESGNDVDKQLQADFDAKLWVIEEETQAQKRHDMAMINQKYNEIMSQLKKEAYVAKA